MRFFDGILSIKGPSSVHSHMGVQPVSAVAFPRLAEQSLHGGVRCGLSTQSTRLCYEIQNDTRYIQDAIYQML